MAVRQFRFIMQWSNSHRCPGLLAGMARGALIPTALGGSNRRAAAENTIYDIFPTISWGAVIPQGSAGRTRSCTTITALPTLPSLAQAVRAL